ncbi:MAG: hypothetical protein L3J07_01745 [Candidatus Magasanikbacteria bacterium]|nr:hypothetical protein [Candidatus Magasanikbacteria bacterium]
MNKEKIFRLSTFCFYIGLILVLVALISTSRIESNIVLFIFIPIGIIFFIISAFFFEKTETEYQRKISCLKNKTEPFKPFIDEEVLITKCPKEFKTPNKWTLLTIRIIETGFLDSLEDIRNWNFRTTDDFWKKAYIKKLLIISNSKHLEKKDKVAIISWKLSLILNEPPE